MLFSRLDEQQLYGEYLTENGMLCRQGYLSEK